MTKVGTIKRAHQDAMPEFVIATYPATSHTADSTGGHFQQLNYRTGGDSEFKVARASQPGGYVPALKAPALVPKPADVPHTIRAIVNLAVQPPLSLPYFATPSDDQQDAIPPVTGPLLAAALRAYQANAAPAPQVRLVSLFA
jgi:hypothetical protein